MKKYIQPSMEILELQSESSMMDILVTSTAVSPGSALGNGRRSAFDGGNLFGNPFETKSFE